jgi:hypothetical protein
MATTVSAERLRGAFQILFRKDYLLEATEVSIAGGIRAEIRNRSAIGGVLSNEPPSPFHPIKERWLKHTRNSLGLESQTSKIHFL